MAEFFSGVLDLARAGFAEVNAFQGLLVAVVAAIMMSAWSRLFIIAVGAVIAHILLDVLAPVIAEVGGFMLPPLLEAWYWQYVGILFVGYLIVISVLFAIKRLLLKG